MMKASLSILLVVAFLLAGCGGNRLDPDRITDLGLARRALIDFFEAVVDGDYQNATTLHGENADFYQTARDNNPDVNPDDRAALLGAACERQLMCLTVSNIVSAEQVSNHEFLFVVEFVNEDGSPFVLGPCCGEDETSMLPTSEFEYRVEKTDNGFVVIGSPPYVP